MRGKFLIVLLVGLITGMYGLLNAVLPIMVNQRGALNNTGNEVENRTVIPQLQNGGG